MLDVGRTYTLWFSSIIHNLQSLVLRHRTWLASIFCSLHTSVCTCQPIAGTRPANIRYGFVHRSRDICIDQNQETSPKIYSLWSSNVVQQQVALAKACMNSPWCVCIEKETSALANNMKHQRGPVFFEQVTSFMECMHPPYLMHISHMSSGVDCLQRPWRANNS